MSGPMTTIVDPAAPPGTKPREFAFDYSYWSFDDFEEDENGCRGACVFVAPTFDAPTFISRRTATQRDSLPP